MSTPSNDVKVKLDMNDDELIIYSQETAPLSLEMPTNDDTQKEELPTTSCSALDLFNTYCAPDSCALPPLDDVVPVVDDNLADAKIDDFESPFQQLIAALFASPNDKVLLPPNDILGMKREREEESWASLFFRGSRLDTDLGDLIEHSVNNNTDLSGIEDSLNRIFAKHYDLGSSEALWNDLAMKKVTFLNHICMLKKIKIEQPVIF